MGVTETDGDAATPQTTATEGAYSPGGIAGYYGAASPSGAGRDAALVALGRALAHRGAAEHRAERGRIGLVVRGSATAPASHTDRDGTVVVSAGVDPAAVADRYASGGVELLATLPTPWTAALLDPAREALVLVAAGAPLYYAPAAAGVDGLAFASEPAALVEAGLVSSAPDTERVVEFILTGGGEDGEATFFAGIRRLPAGQALIVDSTGAVTRSIDAVVPPVDGLAAARRALATGQRPAVRLGLGLPGAALAATAKNTPDVPASAVFSASFAPMDTTEDLYSGAVSAALGTTVHSVRVNADTLAADLPAFLRVQGEPVADLGEYVQYAVAKTAREGGADSLLDPTGAIAAYGLTVEATGKKPRREVAPTTLLAPTLAHARTTTGADGSPVAPPAAKAAARLAEARRTADRSAARLGIRIDTPFANPVADAGQGGASLRAALPAGAPGDVRTSAPVRDWLLRLKNRIYGTFLAESFVNRPWFHQQNVLVAFEDFIKGRNHDADLFWRIWCVEIWAQEFLDPKPEEKEPTRIKGPLEPNANKQLEITVSGERWIRFPIRTELFTSGDDYTRRITSYVSEFVDHVRADGSYLASFNGPWYLLVSEKIIAISQGRSYFIWDIEPSWWARTLAKFVVKTPYGIGLGSPWTMELAIREAGLPRILFAAGISAAGKAVGKRGLFYQVAGHSVRAIDGPTEYSVYPANVSAKLAPAHPDRVATKLKTTIAATLTDAGLPQLAQTLAGVVVIDANDIGRNVLGSDADRPEEFFENLFGDNPLGQGSEQTPLAVAVRVG
ncbi:asparagine synthase-related protein [Cryptosporangium aurantiacum]|uniref:Asparagine synthase (Glutamine-hydrolysing) n=1 Tax=Cryptosporangium aurantiacum TaxID=134849 RepID=A0A1M7QS08_9ACTN|nr:asparagine synthase-related protein [Cryptosporangium aurantiacum]SHN34420.1 asparagine synthase (glutamine-hydrolysing) [Cryptosporangium aurantiacum]